MTVQAIITWFVILGIVSILTQLQLWAVRRELLDLRYQVGCLKILVQSAGTKAKSSAVEFEPKRSYDQDSTNGGIDERRRSTIIPDPQRGSTSRRTGPGSSDA